MKKKIFFLIIIIVIILSGINIYADGNNIIELEDMNILENEIAYKNEG